MRSRSRRRSSAGNGSRALRIARRDHRFLRWPRPLPSWWPVRHRARHGRPSGTRPRRDAAPDPRRLLHRHEPVTVTSRSTAAPRRPCKRRPDAPPARKQGLLAVIIDDAGYSLEELQAFLDLPMPLTVAVLPNLPHSTEAARRVAGRGEGPDPPLPHGAAGRENPGPGAIYTGQSAARDRIALLDCRFRLGAGRHRHEQPHGIEGHGGRVRS